MVYGGTEFCFFSSRRRHTRCALVTGVQTCALPICLTLAARTCAIPVSLFRFSAGWVRLCCDRPEPDMGRAKVQFLGLESGVPEIGAIEIGRASCRERVCQYV